MFRSGLVLIAIVIGCSLPGVVYAQSESQINIENAKDLLNKMRASRNKMKNLQFEYEHIIWRNLDLEDTRRHINPEAETIYLKYKVVLDCKGREKKHYYEYGIFDSSDKKEPVETHLENRAWDGHIGVEHIYHRESPGGAIIDSSPPHSLIYTSQPWKSCTGYSIELMAKAIDEQKKPVGVEMLPDGKYQVSYYNSRNNTDFVDIIDPEKGYSRTRMTSFVNGIKRSYHKTEYEEFADGVWFPVTAEKVSVTNDGTVFRRRSIKTSNIKVNDPNFSEDLFHIDLPKGTRVTDKVTGIEYVVGDSMS